ncbi:hypothetical protein Taro_004117, partial [Colocasia esculenta]|nr:hypothetical protein [Colocasia esculenta]
VAVVRPSATGEPAGLARFGIGNAVVKPGAFLYAVITTSTAKASTCLPPAFICRVTKLVTMLASWLARCPRSLLFPEHPTLDVLSEFSRIFQALCSPDHLWIGLNIKWRKLRDVAVVRPGATGEPAGLARFGIGNAAVKPVAFMTRRRGLPRHSCYRGASRRRDNRGGPVFF